MMEYKNEDLDQMRPVPGQNVLPSLEPEELDQPEPQDLPSIRRDGLLSILTSDWIDKQIAELDQRTGDFDTSKKRKVVIKKLGDLKIPFEFYFVSEKFKPEGSKKRRTLHNYLMRSKGPFSDDFQMLCLMNFDGERMKSIDNNIDQYEMLHKEWNAARDTQVQILRVKTKSFAIVSPKEFLTVQVQTRKGPGRMYTLAQSIGFNNMDKEPSLHALRESLKSENLIYMSGSCLTDEGRAMFTRGDFDTSMGSMVLKPIFKSTFSKYYKYFFRSMVSFLFETRETPVVWFGEGSEEAERILAEQRRSLYDWVKAGTGKVKEDQWEALVCEFEKEGSSDSSSTTSDEEGGAKDEDEVVPKEDPVKVEEEVVEVEEEAPKVEEERPIVVEEEEPKVDEPVEVKEEEETEVVEEETIVEIEEAVPEKEKSCSSEGSKSSKSSKSCKSRKSCKSVESNKSNKSHKSHKSHKSNKSGKSNKSQKSNKSNRSKSSKKSNKSGGSHKSHNSRKSSHSHHSHHSKKSHKSDS